MKRKNEELQVADFQKYIDKLEKKNCKSRLQNCCKKSDK